MIIFLRNSLQGFYMSKQLFFKDTIGNFKQSLLGLFWILATPLFGIVSWLYMNYMGVLEPGDVGVPYPVYVLLGTTIWGFFVSLVTLTSQIYKVSSGFIIQIRFPREALYLKELMRSIFLFGIKFSVTLLVIFLLGVIPSWKIILVPILLIPLMVFGLSVGIILSFPVAISSGMTTAITMLLNLAMFLTPVIYSFDKQNGKIYNIARWNPLTYMVNCPREIILTGQYDYWGEFLIVFLISFFALAFSVRFFQSSEDIIIDKIL